MKRYLAIIAIGIAYVIFIVSFAVAENMGVIGNKSGPSIVSTDADGNVLIDRLTTHNGDPSPFPPLPPPNPGFGLDRLKQHNGDPSPFPPLPPPDPGIK